MNENLECSATVSRVVEWWDTDAAGHQHNSTIMRHVEAAEAQLFRDLNIAGYFVVAPRVRQEIDFESKLYFGQGTTTTVRIVALGSASMTLEFEVWGDAFEGAPRRRAASGRLVSVHVPLGTERSAPWPPEVRDAIRRHARPAG